MKNLLNKAGILSLIILAISFLGCEDDDDANGLPEVVAAFTQTQIENTGVVSFINISENADSFSWDFGDGTTSTEMDPVKTFAEGSFTVTLTASNAAGASNTFSDELTVDLPDGPPPFDSGLLANGDFENGTEGWSGNAANVQTDENGNNFNFANVET
ncbi:MAG: PKD domain-containing protein, partial [Bacteroidota bacterium]